MPRLPPPLLRRAYKISPHLPPLVRATRSIESAQIELRWLQEHVASKNAPKPSLLLQNYIFRRSFLAEPLQYILGSQPFGSVDILCRRNVLIPRAETEESVSHLASLLKKQRWRRKAKVVDLCTGTGCIPLLLAAETPVAAVGVDVSPYALGLAMRNVRHNAERLKEGSTVEVLDGDLLAEDEEMEQLLYSLHAYFDEMDPGHEAVDVVVSNPPYISADGYKRETARSVRNWEPRIALEAEDQGDVFYPRIGGIAWELGARAVVAEVGGWEQAERVRSCWKEMGWVGTEVWSDFAGRGRTVVAWREGGEWIREGPNEAP
jgi:HemK-like putative methylase